MIHLSELLNPRPEQPMWDLIRQCGVNNAIALLNGAEQEQRMFASVGMDDDLGDDDAQVPWGEAAIKRDMDMFAENGLRVIGIEDTAPMDKVRLGLDGRDEQIDNVIVQLRAMGRLEIPVLCYNWMAVSSWARTDVAVPARAGALVTGFDKQKADAMPPLVDPGEVSDEQLWDALQYFLDAVMPAAEEAGVRMGMHPDDPPIASVRNMPRIMRSPDAYRRLLAMHPSPSNAITFCQGNFALMTDDLPALIREFGGQDKIIFSHFRDVQGTADHFVETFHDEGQNDLAECMRAYHDIGFDGPMRPDHVPTMAGESNDRPAYGVLGRLFAMGYIRGLDHAIFGRNGIVS